ncbi:DNA-binding protein [Rickenella mellea]|uniref:DNA-binding protein n=1 Tax=Rickenella mellea TaxID=50990 RepID=A0A4Y7QCL3_9AGAM|nr:DNA-binding protein [Rickenella mellea]
MQSQALRQKTAISPQQSLAVVKTLLSASFGCIAYLRNLLPEENFGEGRLTSAEQGNMSFESASQETAVGEARRNYSNVKIKTVTRGYSPEADKLLDYLENGIFHALERQYLKSFIFAIYLDNEDPNNIVEAYTYDFSYRTIPGTNTVVPIMTLGEDLMKMTLNGQPPPEDPVALATMKGVVPTLGDVKKSVKALIKNLVMVIQMMDALPKRRYATFKLFYRDNTPEDYEPPYFRPGDPDKDKFIFTTHGKSEVPEKSSIGKVLTPHHGVDVHVESVVSFLPSVENNEAQYAGCASLGGISISAPSSTAAAAKQAELQRKDAECRAIVWDAEKISALSDLDADGEVDPDYADDSGIGFSIPLGVRMPDGTIAPISPSDDSMQIDPEAEAEYCGQREIAPSRVGRLQEMARVEPDMLIEPTQPLESTQCVEDVSQADTEKQTQLQETLGQSSVISRGIDTQVLKDMLLQAQSGSTINGTEDSEMLDLETQREIHESIESFSSGSRTMRSKKANANPLTRRSFSVEAIGHEEDIKCACELTANVDDCLKCEGPCGRWYHIWCMGYHFMQDRRLLDEFICVGCLLRGDVNFELIRHSFPDIMLNFKDIATFRRAIKLAETKQPESLKSFKRVMGDCPASLAQQLWKRLEMEGFIILEITETDSSGMLVTRTQVKSSHKKAKRKTKETSRYIFNFPIKKTAVYNDYFDPCSEVEKKLLGLKGPGRKGKNKSRKQGGGDKNCVAGNAEQVNEQSSVIDPILPPDPIQPIVRDSAVIVNPGTVDSAILDATAEHHTFEIESQTQEDTQLADPFLNADLKRKISSEDQARTSKKVKISIGDGIDIEE